MPAAASRFVPLAAPTLAKLFVGELLAPAHHSTFRLQFHQKCKQSRKDGLHPSQSSMFTARASIVTASARMPTSAKKDSRSSIRTGIGPFFVGSYASEWKLPNSLIPGRIISTSGIPRPSARRACQIDGLLFGLHCDRQASIVRHFQKLSRFPAATGPDDAYHSSASISPRLLICAPPSTKPSARSIACPSPSARAQSPEPTYESPIARGCRGATSESFASFGR